ncbi:MAG: hypothetical protein HQ523_11360 [Lentisphaerae bacterium]|nr:hypothetical protein [Lentisphaerota bacterium]
MKASDKQSFDEDGLLIVRNLVPRDVMEHLRCELQDYQTAIETGRYWQLVSKKAVR